MPQTPGVPDHAAPSTAWWSSLPVRTLVQGVAVDVLLAVCLVVYQATSGESVDWRLLLVTVTKTALMTAASSIMRRIRPPTD